MRKFFIFKKNNEGYTIIEVMISIAVFLIVITMGVNSLISMNLVINHTSKSRTLMDSLSFAMEEMSRNIRTGYDYSQDNGLSNIYFTESITQGRWAYRIIPSQKYSENQSFILEKSIDKGESWIPLIGEAEIEKGIKIKQMSSFSVVGASHDDFIQPFVNIKLVGEIHYKSNIIPFTLQTSVSQMYPDIP